jgi:hypothetical protein
VGGGCGWGGWGGGGEVLQQPAKTTLSTYKSQHSLLWQWHFIITNVRLTVIMLRNVMLGVTNKTIMLSVVILNVIMLNVRAPGWGWGRAKSTETLKMLPKFLFFLLLKLCLSEP